MLLIDTNVLVDVLQDDPTWSEWSLAQLQAQSNLHALVINPVIYAELSLSFTTIEALDEALAAMQLKVEPFPKPALFLAGKAFMKYRQQGGPRQHLLPDFMIGAHAAVKRWGILTRDVRRYRHYFPTVPLIAPSVP